MSKAKHQKTNQSTKHQVYGKLHFSKYQHIFSYCITVHVCGSLERTVISSFTPPGGGGAGGNHTIVFLPPHTVLLSNIDIAISNSLMCTKYRQCTHREIYRGILRCRQQTVSNNRVILVNHFYYAPAPIGWGIMDWWLFCLFVCLSISLSVCPVPDLKSRTER